MSLMNKLKNILFEEEEVEIPIIEKKEPQIEAQSTHKQGPVKEEAKPLPMKEQASSYDNYYDNLEPILRQETKNEERNRFQYESSRVEAPRPQMNLEKTFNFPDFDEEEFESVAPPRRSTNVMEHERKKEEKKVQATMPTSAVKKVENKKEEVTKFRPSPIISPVYGILDKNYTPEDITSRTPINSKLDVDSVRKKAFGALDTSKKVNSRNEEEKVEDKILEEKLEKARTIDELLKDSSDEILDLSEKMPVKNEANGEEIASDEDFKEVITSLDELDNKKEVEPVKEDETLESDLFDLIDSMYENREEDE